MIEADYRRLVEHYEACLARHGDTHLGVDWPRPEDALRRYEVMLGVIRPEDHTDRPPSVLDFGCGAGHLYDYLAGRPDLPAVRYSGLDLSQRFIDLCRSKHPDVIYHCRDVLQEGVRDLPRYDYVIANGLFTEKRELSFESMLAYFEAMVPVLFMLANVGIAFNVMSSHVDWERSDLFHLPLDTLCGFLTKQVTRHFVLRNDYGLYEYTVYAYREPSSWPGSSSSA